LRGLGEAYLAWGAAHWAQGDFTGALSHLNHSVEQMKRIRPVAQ